MEAAERDAGYTDQVLSDMAWFQSSKKGAMHHMDQGIVHTI